MSQCRYDKVRTNIKLFVHWPTVDTNAVRSVTVHGDISKAL